jgi:hypothetical protein
MLNELLLIPAYVSPVGATAFTSMLMLVLVLPPLFEAVTTYDIAGSITVLAVPVITPVAELRLRPSGRAGLTLNDAAPPLTDGAIGDTVGGTPTVKLRWEGE